MKYTTFAQATRSVPTIDTTVPYDVPEDKAGSDSFVWVGGVVVVGAILVIAIVVGVVLRKKRKGRTTENFPLVTDHEVTNSAYQQLDNQSPQTKEARPPMVSTDQKEQ